MPGAHSVITTQETEECNYFGDCASSVRNNEDGLEKQKKERKRINQQTGVVLTDVDVIKKLRPSTPKDSTHDEEG